MDIDINHILFCSYRPSFDYSVMEELGLTRQHKRLVSREAYDKSHRVPEEQDLRILSPKSAALSFREMCKDPKAELMLALNDAQTRELYYKMPQKGMPIDVMLMFRVHDVDKQGNETTLYDLLRGPKFPADMTAEDMYAVMQEIPSQDRPLFPLLSDIQNPVVVVCYQPLEQALQYAERRYQLLGKRLSDEARMSLERDDKILQDVLTISYEGLILYPQKDLIAVGRLVKDILEEKGKWLKRRGLVPLDETEW